MTQILVSSERESLKVIVDDSSVKNRRGEELGCGGRIVRRFVDVLDNAELQLNWKTDESSHGGRWTEIPPFLPVMMETTRCCWLSEAQAKSCSSSVGLGVTSAARNHVTTWWFFSGSPAVLEH
jgi:hypothetical protein